jgi:predicted double-glycine peptidase
LSFVNKEILVNIRNLRLTILLSSAMLFVSCVYEVGPRGPATVYDSLFVEVVKQEHDKTCGLASLLTIMRYQFGDTRFDERALLEKFKEKAGDNVLQKVLHEGFSFLEMEALAQSVGYATFLEKYTFEQLERRVNSVPVLVLLERGELRHFVVVRGVSRDLVSLADPARGNLQYPREQFLAEWRTSGGLVVVRKEGSFNSRFLQKPPTVR